VQRPFPASITQDGEWSVAQCLESDVASQGETEDAALSNLHEALTLHFTPQSRRRSPIFGRLRSRLGPPRPLPYREVKRTRRVAGLTKASQRSSHGNVTLVAAASVHR
jgi:predicted RNase H-like HicB family nuclease